MKVVLFCGGLGTRLREHSETYSQADGQHRLSPPIIWHLMKYYSHHGCKQTSSSAWATGATSSSSTSSTTTNSLSNNFVLAKGGKGRSAVQQRYPGPGR